MYIQYTYKSMCRHKFMTPLFIFACINFYYYLLLWRVCCRASKSCLSILSQSLQRRMCVCVCAFPWQSHFRHSEVLVLKVFDATRNAVVVRKNLWFLQYPKFLEKTCRLVKFSPLRHNSILWNSCRFININKVNWLTYLAPYQQVGVVQ